MLFIFLIFLALFIYFVLNYDADMTTIYYEKYGQNLKDFYQEKPVWVKGGFRMI